MEQKILYTEIEDTNKKTEICLYILHSLPNWFGIPESIEEYAREVKPLTFYACQIGSEIVGFVALKTHNKDTSEIYVIGILPQYHRKGIGKHLIHLCIQNSVKNGNTFLTVKTLADTHPDIYYAKTRAFYQKMGFKPLEILEEYWDKNNPCLLMAKFLDKSSY